MSTQTGSVGKRISASPFRSVGPAELLGGLLGAVAALVGAVGELGHEAGRVGAQGAARLCAGGCEGHGERTGKGRGPLLLCLWPHSGRPRRDRPASPSESAKGVEAMMWPSFQNHSRHLAALGCTQDHFSFEFTAHCKGMWFSIALRSLNSGQRAGSFVKRLTSSMTSRAR